MMHGYSYGLQIDILNAELPVAKADVSGSTGVGAEQNGVTGGDDGVYHMGHNHYCR